MPIVGKKRTTKIITHPFIDFGEKRKQFKPKQHNCSESIFPIYLFQIRYMVFIGLNEIGKMCSFLYTLSIVNEAI